jgi:hypothetical protein
MVPDPDTGGPKTCGSVGSGFGSGTLVRTSIYSVQINFLDLVLNFISAGKTDRGGMMVQFMILIKILTTYYFPGPSSCGGHDQTPPFVIITQLGMLNLVNHYRYRYLYQTYRKSIQKRSMSVPESLLLDLAA